MHLLLCWLLLCTVYKLFYLSKALLQYNAIYGWSFKDILHEINFTVRGNLTTCILPIFQACNKVKEA